MLRAPSSDNIDSYGLQRFFISLADQKRIFSALFRSELLYASQSMPLVTLKRKILEIKFLAIKIGKREWKKFNQDDGDWNESGNPQRKRKNNFQDQERVLAWHGVRL